MEEMEYIKIPLHGKRGKGKYTLVDGDYDGEYFSQYRWYLLPNGYAGRAMIELPSKERTSYVYLHKEVCKTPPGYIVDHINRDKLDNRSCNLRWATYSDNANNRDNTNISSAVKKRKGNQNNRIDVTNPIRRRAYQRQEC